MTPQEHNKYLAISHLVHGSLMSLLGIVMIAFLGSMFRVVPDPPPAPFIVLMNLFILFIYGVMSVPSFVAGYGLLKRRKWARTAAIVSAVIGGANFPIGTAVCIYTFWFIFSEPGKALFEQQRFALPPGQQTWAGDFSTSQHQHQPEYTPPPTPPDWR